MPGFGAVGKMVGGGLKKAAKRTYDRGAVKQGVDAFRSFKQKKTSSPMKSSLPAAPKRVGSFDTGVNTQLKVPTVGGFNKRSGFQNDKLF